MELSGQKVLVVGLGKSGVAAVRLLLERGARVIANDMRSLAELTPEVAALAEQGVELVLGSHENALFTAVDRIVISPGVPSLPALKAAEAAGVPIASEIELASWFLHGTLIGITGTNGKSTVTTLVGEMCRASGRATFVGGNLGTPLVDAVRTPAAQPGGYVVVELSSFQLERIEHLRVHAAALLNVTDDHLDRYPSFEAYAEAKGAIFRNQTPEDSAVVPAGDALCEALAHKGRGRLHRYGGQAGVGAVRLAGGALVDDTSGLSVPLAELAVTGQHNYENACAAALLARLSGVAREHVRATLLAFRGLPHRMQHVRRLDDVDYYDDSKATNVGATVAALDGVREGRVVLIAGGRDKGGEYTPIASRMLARGRGAVLIGEAAPLIGAALEGGSYPVETVSSMNEAVSRARELARPGDSVLLAPACSSFDMFRSYAHRGDVFQDAVRALGPAPGPVKEGA